MGVDIFVTAGTFIHIKDVPRTKSRVRTFGCPHCKTTHRNASYCQNCGREHEAYLLETDEEKWDLDEITQELASVGIEIDVEVESTFLEETGEDILIIYDRENEEKDYTEEGIHSIPQQIPVNRFQDLITFLTVEGFVFEIKYGILTYYG